MSWYRTYRPQTISGLHLTVAREGFLRMMKAGSISHALLFAGPKGTGKTSSARVIAKMLNCELNLKRKPKEAFQEPCNRCSMCLSITQGSSLNVIEMDAASNRRIDDVRALREKIYVSPATGSKVVYIIDEVHMMTKEAFNALLKILEEPPEHAVFILATTEANKLPDTIVSRCTLIQFQKASLDEVSDALAKIAEQEKITVSKESLLTIAQSADGSFRDGVKLFEQIAAGQTKLDDSLIESNVQNVSAMACEEFISYILQKDEKKIVNFFESARSKQLDPVVFQKALLQFLHRQLLINLGIETGKAIASIQVVTYFLKQFQSVPLHTQSPFPLLDVELVTLEMVLKSKSQSSQRETVVKPRTVEVVLEQKKNDIQLEKVIERTVVELVSIPGNSGDGALLKELWNDLLQSIKQKNLSLEALLRSSQFIFGEEGKVVIEVFYQFHKEQLQVERYRKIVEDEISSLVGGNVRCEYVLSAQSASNAKGPHANVSGKLDEESVEGLASLVDEVLL